MSYILDALRRAEADRERERGDLPGLHSRPAPAGAPAAAPRRWLPWAGAGLLLLAGIAAGSWWSGAEPDAPPAPTPAPAPPPAPAPAAAPLAVVPAAPVPVAASASPYLPPTPPPAPPPVVAAPAARPAPAPEAPLPRLAELPESLRRELPRLTISGSVYSTDAASSFVIINGEVQREGARLGADLVLERIRPRELVLRFKGQAYRQPV